MISSQHYKIYINNIEDLYAAFSTPIKGVEIEIQEGVYSLTKPLAIIGCEDVVVQGSRNVRLEGGKHFRGGFVQYEDNIYVKKLSETPFCRLYSNGIELSRARFPANDSRDESVTIRGKWDLGERILYLPIKYLSFVQEHVEIDVFDSWVHCFSHEYDYAVEEDRIKITFEEDVRSRIDAINKCLAQEYIDLCFFNSKYFLKKHGEWCFDKWSGNLYVQWNEDNINDVDFIVPVLENLLSIENSKSIQLKNIQFAFSNWQQPLTKQHACYQATIYKKNDSLYRPPAAVSVFNSQKITFTGISIFDTGATGFDILPFCQDITFQEGAIQRTGGNGICIGYFTEHSKIIAHKGLPYRPTDFSEVVSNVMIQNNRIKDIGIFEHAGTGILAGFCRDLYIFRNEVEGVSYSGIAIGWGWLNNALFSVISNIQVHNNKIINYLNSDLYDGAGIYFVGGQSGEKRSCISGNYLVGTRGLGMIYLDEGCSHCLVENNVCDGNALKGLIYCHDYGNALHDLTIKRNFGKQNFFCVDFNINPKGPTQKERNIFCEDIRVYTDKFDDQEAAQKIISESGCLLRVD